MKGFCPLASGSKGNALYLGTGEKKILVDAGIGIRTVESRLKQIGVELDQIDAILVTHDHGDHVLGIGTFALKKGIPVFANAETAKGVVSVLKKVPKFKIFTTGEPFIFGDIEITPFSIPHDTIDPVGFTFQTENVKIGVCADLGFVTALVRSQLQRCDYLYLEANHEPSWVYASPRPQIYKERVLGKLGHLSNQDCGKLLCQVAHSHLKKVWLAHLSSECNSEEKALFEVRAILEKEGMDFPMSVAYQNRLSRAVLF